MALAIGAGNFCAAHTQRIIGMPDNCAGYFIVKRGPAAAAVKLVGGLVQRRIAAPADEQALAFVVPIFARKGPFGAFFFNDISFFRGQLIPILDLVFHLFCYLSCSGHWPFQEQILAVKDDLKGKFADKYPQSMFKNTFLLAFFLAWTTILSAVQAPDFTITDSDGKTLNLYSDFVNQGKVVVLEIFFTTCPPCATYAPHWQSLYSNVKSQYPGKVEFIMLSDKSADNNAAVAQYKTSKSLTMVGAGSDGGSLSAVQPYKSGQFGPFYGTPTFIIITPGTGEVVYDVRGSGATSTMDSIHQKIAQMLLLPDCHIQTPQGDTLQKYRLRLDVPGGSPVHHQVTDGVYALNDFPGLPGLPYFEIRPSKNDQPLNGVSTFDLVQINKQILGITPFQAPWQFIAADANSSGTITTFDIVELRKLILGVYDSLLNSPSWVFTPAFDTISPMACPEFTAIKRGDVNGNANSDSLWANNDRDTWRWPLWITDQVLQSGQIYSIPIQTDQKGSWTGLQGAIHYDPTAFEILDVHSEQLTGWEQASWFSKTGRLSWSWFAADPVAMQAGTPVFTLECRALRPGRLSELLLFETAPLRGELYDAHGKPYLLDWRYSNVQNLYLAPNPAQGQVRLSLKSEIAEVTTIQFIDVQGRVVWTQNWLLQVGSNRLELQPTALPAGIYTVRVGASTAAKLFWQP